MMRKSPTSWHSTWKQVGPYMDLGLRLVISLLMGIFGGYWLDRKLHTLPLFLLIGFLFGAFSGFLSIYHTVFSKKQK